MESSSSRFLLRITATLALAACLVFGVTAQDDPDPNSPTPILLSERGSTRALASFEGQRGQVFQPDSRIVVYVTGFKLSDDEGANAFRIHVEDADGRKYRFPVTDIQGAGRGIYELTVQLTDQIRFWEPPKANGDLLIGVTWRGLISNRVKLGLGQTGGRIKDDPGAIPTPTGKELAGRTKPGGPAPEYVGYRWSGDRSRFLQQATFGQNALLDSRIRRIGLRTWLAEQFDAQYPSAGNPYPDFPLKGNDAASAATGCGNFPNPSAEFTLCLRDHYTMYQPQTWFFREALHGDAQLRHRVSWSLAQILVTAAPEVQQNRHMMEYYKILGNNAFGNYRNLMKEMTLSPTMGNYLDMAFSSRTNPNENYARELMQLFSVGLFVLNQDGTLKLDSTGNPIPTYDQNGVNNLTKLLTGFTFCGVVASCPNIVSGTVNYIDPMRIINTGNHDLTAKTLLSWPADSNFPPNNTNVAACSNCTNAANITTYANASLEQAIDNAYNHPNVGPFVSKILIQHMVTSDPTPAYVGRVAAVFNANRSNPTQMKEVIRAILLDPEARGDFKSDPAFGKLREPVQFATNILRSFGVRNAAGNGPSDGYFYARGEFLGMAQIPFQSPTVFNFYPPDYGIPGTTLLGPEFAIMTTGTAIQRTNFVNRFVFTDIPFPVALPNAPLGTSLDFSDLQALAAADATGGLLVDELNRRILHNRMSAQMRSTIMTAVTAYPSATPADLLNRTRQAIYLVTTSSQFQVQR